MTTNQPDDPGALPPEGTPQGQPQLPPGLDPRVQALVEAELRARAAGATPEERAAANRVAAANLMAPLKSELGSVRDSSDDDDYAGVGFNQRWQNVSFTIGTVFIGFIIGIAWWGHAVPAWYGALMVSLAVLGVVAAVLSRRGGRARGRSVLFIRLWSSAVFVIAIVMLVILGLYAAHS